MCHDAKEGFALGLREIISKDRQPRILRTLSVGIDRNKLLAVLARRRVKVFELVVGFGS